MDSCGFVPLCPLTDCALWSYRLGKNPNRKPRELTEEQRTALADRLRTARTGQREAHENRQILTD